MSRNHVLVVMIEPFTATSTTPPILRNRQIRLFQARYVPATASLCNLCVLCVSVVFYGHSTTETQRTRSFHREGLIQLFGISENLEDLAFSAKGAEQRGRVGILAVCSLHLVLKPDRDSTTNRPSIVTDDGQDLAVLITRLRVQQVARVENGFCPNRQSKTRQLLRDLNTQRWIVNTQSTRKRIDRKYGRFRREPEHGSHLRTTAEHTAQLQ